MIIKFIVTRYYLSHISCTLSYPVSLTDHPGHVWRPNASSKLCGEIKSGFALILLVVINNIFFDFRPRRSTKATELPERTSEDYGRETRGRDLIMQYAASEIVISTLDTTRKVILFCSQKLTQ